MAEESKVAAGEGVSSEDGSQKADDSQTSIDRAELEGLKTQAKRMEGLDAIAKDASTADETLKAEDYLGYLEDEVYRKDEKPEAKPEVKLEEKPKGKEPAKSEATPIPTPTLGEEEKRTISQAQQTANLALLAVQYSDFQTTQNMLPEDQRSVFAKIDLQKVIMGPESALVGSVAKSKFDGNVYAAANYIHALTEGPDLLAKARKEGADSEAAKELARASAQLPGNIGRVAEPAVKTIQEKAQEENDKLADEISPETVYVPQEN